MGSDTEDFKQFNELVEKYKTVLEKDMPTNDDGVTYETVTFKATPAHVGRKQFVRNLQKIGYSKKKAKQIADEMRKNGTTYTRANFLYTICCEPWLDWPKQEVDE